jgi:hypothetical protein
MSKLFINWALNGAYISSKTLVVEFRKAAVTRI